MNRSRAIWQPLLALWFGAVLTHGASAARWFDSLPADDPDTVVRHGTATPTLTADRVPQAYTGLPASVAYGAASVVGATYHVTTGLLWSVVGGVGAIASGTSEALYETAYMFGVNRTPVPRTAIADPVPELKVVSEDVAPASAAAHITWAGSLPGNIR